jgi:hypothetical protein
MVATTRSLEELMQQYGIPSSGKSLSGHFNSLETLELTETARGRDRTVSQIIVAATKLAMGQLTVHKIGKAMLSLRDPEAVKPKATAQQKRLITQHNISLKGKTLTGHFSPQDAVDLLQLLERVKEMFEEDFSISEFLVTMTFTGLPAARQLYPEPRTV